VKIDLVSEHASPLAAIGGADAGGQNVHVAALARGLAALGNEVRVLTRRDRSDLPASVAMAPGIEVVHLDAGPAAPIPRDDVWHHLPELAERVAALWSAAPPDVAHAHFWMSGVASVAAAGSAALPVALTFHAFGAEKRQHQGGADTSPPERIPAEAALTRDVDLIVATTRAECRMHLAAGVAVPRIDYVPCGVDTRRFRPAWERQRPGRDSSFTLGFVGRLVDRKGILDLFEALASVPDVRLVVVGGEGPPERDPAVDRYREAAGALGVADRVTFLGGVARGQVPGVLRRVDAVVCCPWYEPFGLVALEAMASGLPVIATRVGGLAETVVHEVTGLHVPPRSPGDLAAAIEALRRDAGRRLLFGMAGRRRARRYSWDRVALTTAQSLGRLVTPHRAGRAPEAIS
jgi:glycosyltransferase involved in cell wall biosynthesis